MEFFPKIVFTLSALAALLFFGMSAYVILTTPLAWTAVDMFILGFDFIICAGFFKAISE